MVSSQINSVPVASEQTAFASALDAYIQALIKFLKAELNLEWTGSDEAKISDTGTYQSPSKLTTIEHLYKIYCKLRDEYGELIRKSFWETIYGLPWDTSKDHYALRRKIDTAGSIADSKYNYNVDCSATEVLNTPLKPGPPDTIYGRGGMCISETCMSQMH